MIPPEWFSHMTEGPWWMDIAAFATAITAIAIIWRMAVWPFFRAVWAAIRAAPRIPIILDDVLEILRSDVVDKLDEIQNHVAKHEAEAEERNSRIEHHTQQLEDHEIRIANLERRGE